MRVEVELRREGSRGRRKDDVLEEEEEADKVDEAALLWSEVEGEYIVRESRRGDGKRREEEKERKGGVGGAGG